MIGFTKRGAMLVALAAGLLTCSAEVSSAALASASGGSGYSGVLSSKKSVRKQQLICDPTTAGSGVPTSGSTSVSYNPALVTIAGFQFGPGYTGQAYVELIEPPASEGGPPTPTLAPFAESASAQPRPGQRFFETISNYLADRNTERGEVETGYIQVVYNLVGTAGVMHPDPGFIPVASAGVNGVDTHSLTFSYLNTTPDTRVATYRIFADLGGRPSGNRTDTLSGIGPDGKPFTVGPSQLSPATVSGNLIASAVPLPPAVWTGMATLAVVFAGLGLRRRGVA